MSWYKNAVIYELHVRAFADSNGDGIGDFPGLTGKLGYLRDLGITALWLLPFCSSPLRDGGYDISDYTGIHPDYGTNDDFVRFLEEAHRLEIKVITELVINHTSSEHAWFQRARLAPPGSAEREFYVWSDTPDRYADARIIFKDFENSNWAWDPVAKAYYWHRFYSHQPDLNYDHPAVHEAIFDVLDYWMGLGVDGVRLDAIPYLYEREGTSCENLPETHTFLKRLRAHVDDHFQDRILLAEANQWPEDAAAYFGAGDECHLNFHFPLMPRLFMSVQLEDSFPIVDILSQTPDIPNNCQWATFLRNHDELTLEMVTEEERDYMYRVYASDHRARLNLGIRRRLAPLLEDRRCLELLNAILFSLPGTPVIYYGDEIGMGDNIYLGDRDGVRTPMQWNSDRNAGFSRANPQQLYLPLVVDPHFHYEAINVEAQQANHSSLLWWVKHLIALRRRSPVFGAGKLSFVDPGNAKVLAFVRELDGERVLFVANLSRFPQHACLLMGDYSGLEPVEMLGRNRFPRVESERWGITLGPYNHFWFELRVPESIELAAHHPLVTQGAWWHVVGDGSREFTRRLALYARGCRWFRNKSMVCTGRSIRDVFTLKVDGERLMLVLLQLDFGSSSSETYAIPLAYLGGVPAKEREASHPGDIVLPLQVEYDDGRDPEYGVLIDALSSRACLLRLLDALLASEKFNGWQGELVFTGQPELKTVAARGPVVPQPVALDSTNSVTFFGTQLVFKLLRVADENPNAEEETVRFLSERSARLLTPQLLGTVQWKPRVGQPALLAICTEYLANRGTAWDLVAHGLSTYFERALAQNEPAPPMSTLLGSDRQPLPAGLVMLTEPLPALIELLARRTVELHEVLASDPTSPDFSPQPFDVLYQQSLYHTARGSLSRTLVSLRRSLPKLPEGTRDAAARILERTRDIDLALREVTLARIDAYRIRAHGDLHLGQVLFTGDNFIFIDFEGEPARSPQQRRYKRCPLRDAAGIVRSLAYAAESALRLGRVRPDDLAELTPWVLAWETHFSRLFIETYVDAVARLRLIPESLPDSRRLLRFYLLEKAIYEVGYELNNRPDWLMIPLTGLERLLSQDW